MRPRLRCSGSSERRNTSNAISMHGRGSWRDNVFVKWLKYEEVSLKAYAGVGEARASIGRYLDFNDGKRPQSRHGGQPPTKRILTICRWRRHDFIAICGPIPVGLRSRCVRPTNDISWQ